jgi:hypothetical protein
MEQQIQTVHDAHDEDVRILHRKGRATLAVVHRYCQSLSLTHCFQEQRIIISIAEGSYLAGIVLLRVPLLQNVVRPILFIYLRRQRHCTQLRTCGTERIGGKHVNSDKLLKPSQSVCDTRDKPSIERKSACEIRHDARDTQRPVKKVWNRYLDAWDVHEIPPGVEFIVAMLG